ncbi:hypothetical protein [Rhizobium ruizarguesonis]
MRIRYLFAIELMVLLSSSSAFAQSAEETVAFILNGVEDGRKLVSRGADISVIATVKQNASSPAFFTVSPPGKIDLVSIKVTQGSACKFLVERENKDGKRRSDVYDFGKVVDVKYTAGIGLLNFADSCPIKGSDGSCNTTTLIAPDMGTPPQRVRNAITYLKANYCAGSGF